MPDLKKIAPIASQMIRRDLGKYSGSSGVNKFFFLMNAIDYLIDHLGRDVVVKAFIEEIEKLKKAEKELGVEMLCKRIKSWEEAYKVLDYLRPKLIEIQLRYDDIQDKAQKVAKLEVDKKIKYRKLSKRISPYQPELYFIFNVLLRKSDIHRQIIPNEAFKTLDHAQYRKLELRRPKSEVASTESTETTESSTTTSEKQV